MKFQIETVSDSIKRTADTDVRVVNAREILSDIVNELRRDENSDFNEHSYARLLDAIRREHWKLEMRDFDGKQDFATVVKIGNQSLTPHNDSIVLTISGQSAVGPTSIPVHEEMSRVFRDAIARATPNFAPTEKELFDSLLKDYEKNGIDTPTFRGQEMRAIHYDDGKHIEMESKKVQTQEQPQEFKVGDRVKDKDGFRGEITRYNKDADMCYVTFDNGNRDVVCDGWYKSNQLIKMEEPTKEKIDITQAIRDTLSAPTAPESGQIGDVSFKKEEFPEMYTLTDSNGSIVGAFFPESNTLLYEGPSQDISESVRDTNELSV